MNERFPGKGDFYRMVKPRPGMVDEETGNKPIGLKDLILGIREIVAGEIKKRNLSRKEKKVDEGLGN